jgi:hypothetical protein
MMLTDAEITDMLAMTAEHNIELCLLLGPRGTWDTGAATRSTTGGAGARARGRDQLGQCLEDLIRAVGLGVRNALVADEGVLWAGHQLRSRGDLPADLRFKLSVLTGPVNPAAFVVVAALGADSVNVPSDPSIAQIAEMRAAAPAALDLYVEAPDDIGGFVRLRTALRWRGNRPRRRARLPETGAAQRPWPVSGRSASTNARRGQRAGTGTTRAPHPGSARANQGCPADVTGRRPAPARAAPVHLALVTGIRQCRTATAQPTECSDGTRSRRDP